MTQSSRETISGIMPHDKIPYQIWTDPAIRAIGSLTRSERADFDEIKAGKDQETYLIQRWARLRDKTSLARHNGARALQAVSELINQEAFTGTAEVRRYFPLGLPISPENIEQQSFPLLTETEFIKGFNGVWEQITSQADLLDVVDTNKSPEDFRDQQAEFFAPHLGCLSITRTFGRYGATFDTEGHSNATLPFDSNFVIVRTTEVDLI